MQDPDNNFPNIKIRIRLDICWSGKISQFEFLLDLVRKIGYFDYKSCNFYLTFVWYYFIKLIFIIKILESNKTSRFNLKKRGVNGQRSRYIIILYTEKHSLVYEALFSFSFSKPQKLNKNCSNPKHIEAWIGPLKYLSVILYVVYLIGGGQAYDDYINYLSC